MNRWLELIAELYRRGFNIDPASRVVKWREFDRWPQVSWAPDQYAIDINKQRLEERINAKRTWYRFWGVPLSRDDTNLMG